ncbi:MAG: MIP/aquaporin family protein [Methyloceanibacter sp.]
MHSTSLSRRLAAEALGTAFLLAAIVGSGIMAERLAAGNAGVALLCNSLATGAILYVLITVLAPVSGAHFNPAVTLVFLLRGNMSIGLASAYVACQVVGGVLGTFIAHAMFGLPILEISTTQRGEASLWLAEAVATFGLILTVFGALRWKPDAIPSAVGLYILSAYWFTASTSFANPAVTIARSLTNTFSGIEPAGTPAFILAQLAGAILASLFCQWLFGAANVQTSEEMR